MNLAFIYPFLQETNFDESVQNIKPTFLPLSSSILIGNLKYLCPDIKITHMNLYKEIIQNSENSSILKKHYNDFKEYCDSYLDLTLEESFEKLKKVCKKIVDLFELDKYDHYLFGFIDRSKIAAHSNLILAKYLKEIFPNKKIIFGGLKAYGDDYSKKDFSEYDFIDSNVVGIGEFAIREIIDDIKKSRGLKRIYNSYAPCSKDINTLPNLPDFTTFKSLKYYRYRNSLVESILDLKDDAGSCLFIPYFFSKGCFWNKCGYCGNSTDKLFSHKTIDQIILDLKKLKKLYKTKYFIFFNSNFNFNLNFAKKLTRRIIEEKIDILWTDSFNLSIIDDELIELLAKSGCFRMDIGTVTCNPEIQALYSNILNDNSKLNYLKKIHDKGIWVAVNIISNLPGQLTIDNEKIIWNKYLKYVDDVILNYYRNFSSSDVNLNPENYGLRRVKEKITMSNFDAWMYYVENKFNGSVDERKNLYRKNYQELRNFIDNHPDFSGHVSKMSSIELLGFLYNLFGFKNKKKITKIVSMVEKK